MLAALSGLANVFGGAIAAIPQRQHQVFRVLLPAAAGLLVAAALADILPTAIANTSWAGALALVGYIAMHGTEELFSRLVHEEELAPELGSEPPHRLVQVMDAGEPRITRSSAMVAAFGLTVHAFFDGIALMSGFETGLSVGILLVIAISMHKLVVGFSLGSLIRAADMRRFAAVSYTAPLFVTTVLGALLMYRFGAGNSTTSGMLVGVSGGILLYIGATDIMPRSRAELGGVSFLWGFAGASVFMATFGLLHLVGLG